MVYEAGMAHALKQAKEAFERGEFPVGCVIIEDGRIIATGSRRGTTPDRRVSSEIDHAEIRALKTLESTPKKFDPGRCVLYCTMEPCLMCFGAIILSGIKTIVYAYEDPMGGGTCCDLISMAPLYRDSGIKIIPGVMRQKSLDLFYNFFNKEANQYWKNSYLEAYTLAQKRVGTENK